ncbi:hypothetical protein DFH06DRAFT_61304 [Mycena polygramma]|nr:hypothetical protein DFH06DRAFT_61304 [Mycena polygramma]
MRRERLKGRFLTLTSMLPPLEMLRRPYKSASLQVCQCAYKYRDRQRRAPPSRCCRADFARAFEGSGKFEKGNQPMAHPRPRPAHGRPRPLGSPRRRPPRRGRASPSSLSSLRAALVSFASIPFAHRAPFPTVSFSLTCLPPSLPCYTSRALFHRYPCPPHFLPAPQPATFLPFALFLPPRASFCASCPDPPASSSLLPLILSLPCPRY